jgi:hypothetical protein
MAVEGSGVCCSAMLCVHNERYALCAVRSNQPCQLDISLTRTHAHTHSNTLSRLSVSPLSLLLPRIAVSEAAPQWCERTGERSLHTALILTEWVYSHTKQYNIVTTSLCQDSVIYAPTVPLI